MRKFKKMDTPSVISEELKEKISDFAVRLCNITPTDETELNGKGYTNDLGGVSFASYNAERHGLNFSNTGFVAIIGGVSYVSIRVDFEASVASRITLTLRWSGEQDRALSQVISPLHRESKLGLDFHVKEFVSLFMTACKL